MVAIDFAFRGGATQDPRTRRARQNGVSTLDEGAGDLDGTAFHARMEEQGDRAADARRAAILARHAADPQGEPGRGLRTAAARAERAALRQQRRRAHPCTDPVVAATPEHETRIDIASRAWWATAFPNHPYGRQVNGTLESVARVTRRRHARLSCAVCSPATISRSRVVGDIDTETAGRLIDQHLRRAAGQGAAQAGPRHEDARAGRPHRGRPQRAAGGGDHRRSGIARNDPDFMAAYIVNHILGGGSFRRGSIAKCARCAASLTASTPA